MGTQGYAGIDADQRAAGYASLSPSKHCAPVTQGAHVTLGHAWT